MSISNRIEAFVLFLGDIVAFVAALWLALFIRHGDIPSPEIFLKHLVPFGIIFGVWILVFFIAGLYEKHTLVLRNKLPTTLLNTQIINSGIAVLFFYVIPYFAITPKTILFLHLITSFLLLLFWRLSVLSFLGTKKKENAMLIGSGEEMRELKEEVNNNPRYNLKFVSSVDLDELEGIDFTDEVVQQIYSENITTIVIDLRNEHVASILPHLYNLIFSHVRFIDLYKVYEDIFDRVPLSLVNYNWFLENISTSTRIAYDAIKRLMDIAASVALGTVSLLFYPFVILAIKLDDGGDVFIRQTRIGRNNRPITIYKFRTMSFDDNGEYENKGRENRITRVGVILRKTRIDEIPQLLNVLRGDLSLIGPRPELPALVSQYKTEVPYYNIRHLIKPGLSGWAQLYHENHPHHGADVRETKIKLSHDLYYIKNRSLLLDIKIALKTVKTLFSRTGR